ncbi:polar amino acid transport system substrate-binding protein [Clostridium saccharoperbutylacetonicum]|uniref:Amino acid ABC transporter substrate-binding protein, PAAT family n=1 Tax=Clostridium saccharoperbutylacetonicum N1-4(HMT) TaxID=931276 RepID=M1MCR0_9CLOT|nr:ABC transporter substrate-binding protein [Clostridium saccharoperbutylacetonicum]AGF55689.1 amino acid ABC transporter substrate-binding protein, PAAT family [Clostridium saccharoperbutylacetonicum N1-4(HMT)]NRT63585.1 polar amino acid transport system substrate-binding protein [Clostridium saccharoperbutylacetonicum]NSB26948.1 polar amino acid transport system substrate-binding protein [Clostridium saccharoperbutylacetonicum]NSB40432.1 polar amino acid transport system substrate-binding pr
MKKKFALIVVINLIGIIIGCGASTVEAAIEKDRLQTIIERGVINVASGYDVPFFYMDSKTNQISGIDANIITEIVKRLGIKKTEVKKVPFEILLEKLNTDDSIDIAASGIYIIPEREKLVVFTQPLYKETEAVIVPKFSEINFMSDLKNAVVGVEKGTAFEELAKKWKENNLIKDIMFFENSSELLNVINNGKVDAGISDSVVVNYLLLKNKNLLLRTLKGYTTEIPGTVGIAVRKDDKSLLNALNKTISDMKADGTLYTILVDNGLDKSNIIENR